MRFFAGSIASGGLGLPVIAVQTGLSSRTDNSLQYAIDCLESGQNLLFLDLRERATATVDSNEESLTFKEFLELSCNKGVEESKLQSIFKSLDLDENEKLDREEVSIYIAQQHLCNEVARGKAQKSDSAKDLNKSAKNWKTPVRSISNKISPEMESEKVNREERDPMAEVLCHMRAWEIARRELTDRPARCMEDEGVQDQVKSADCFDVMVAAYFKEIMSGGSSEAEAIDRELVFTPLYQAIEEAQCLIHGGSHTHSHRHFQPKMEDLELVSWQIASALCEDDFEMWFHYEVLPHAKKVSETHKMNQSGTSARPFALPKRDWSWRDLHLDPDFSLGKNMAELEREFRLRYRQFALDRFISPMASNLTRLFSSPRFYAANVRDLVSARQMVNSLVKKDRLPQVTPPEGLELLRSAWLEHDVCIYLEGWYRQCSRIFYSIYLLLGLLMVTATVLNSQVEAQKILVGVDYTVFNHILFALSITASFILSLQGYVNPTMRAARLKSSCATLQSLIWMYRGSVGPFSRNDNSYGEQPEKVLYDSLQEWREELVAGTDLQQTALSKEYPPYIYTHHQHECPLAFRKKELAEVQWARYKSYKIITQDLTNQRAKFKEKIFDVDNKRQSIRGVRSAAALGINLSFYPYTHTYILVSFYPSI